MKWMGPISRGNLMRVSLEIEVLLSAIGQAFAAQISRAN
jgi:hypothetical protein